MFGELSVAIIDRVGPRRYRDNGTFYCIKPLRPARPVHAAQRI